MLTSISCLCEYAQRLKEAASWTPLNPRDLNIKSKIPLFHHTLNIMAILSNDKIHLFEFYHEKHATKNKADISISIPDFKKGYVAAWNKGALFTLGIGTDDGVYLMRNVYPKKDIKDLKEHLTCSFLNGPRNCRIDTISFDPNGGSVIGSGPGIYGFMFWSLVCGFSHNYHYKAEQVKILQYSHDGNFILSVTTDNKIMIWDTYLMHFEEIATEENNEIICAEWRPTYNDIIFIFKNPGLIKILNVSFSQHYVKLMRLFWIDVKVPRQIKLNDNNKLNHIKAIVWGAKGKKIALAIGSSHSAAGCTALFDIIKNGESCTCNFIGYASPNVNSNVIEKKGVNMGLAVQNFQGSNESIICATDNGVVNFLHINDF